MGEETQALPREIARREALCARLDAARRRLEAQAKARVPRWSVRGLRGQGGGAHRGQGPGAKGTRPKPFERAPRGDEQSNLSDPNSRLMRKSRRHEYRQSPGADWRQRWSGLPEHRTTRRTRAEKPERETAPKHERTAELDKSRGSRGIEMEM